MGEEKKKRNNIEMHMRHDEARAHLYINDPSTFVPISLTK